MKILNVLFVSIIILLSSTNILQAQSEDNQIVDSLETVLVKVKGADCSNDLVRIASNVEEVDGVVSCVLVKEGVTSKFEVVFKPKMIAVLDIYNAVENTGGCGNPDARPYTVKNK